MRKIFGLITAGFLVIASSTAWAGMCTYGGKTYSEGAVVNGTTCSCNPICKWV